MGADAPVTVFAGPCSVESYEQLTQVARVIAGHGLKVLRGGTYKARTHSSSFQGLGVEALKILRAVSREQGLLCATEVISELDVELVAEHVDIMQIGTRNAQNYRLISAVGKMGKPVILKRGMGETLEELVASTEYLLDQGCNRIILCERGIRTFETGVRATLDISAVPLLHELAAFPVMVDPSHAAGRSELVAPIARAAIAAGADALMVEIHPTPAQALSDARQQLDLEEFGNLVGSLKNVAASVGRTLQ